MRKLYVMFLRILDRNQLHLLNHEYELPSPYLQNLKRLERVPNNRLDNFNDRQIVVSWQYILTH